LKYPGVQQALCLVEEESKSYLEAFMLDREITRVTSEQYETYRIQKGIPGHPNEVSLQFNPLEVGLKPLISFTKGCYVGQEVIARLETYQNTQETLRRFVLSVFPGQLPTGLFSEKKEKVGVLTSSTIPSQSDEQIYGLGLVVPNVDGSRFIYSGRGNEPDGIAELITK
jgi:folate-binding protein YgfZ